ncbi:Oidioi.mRNA.OKI2018_I69.PAR.g9205.t1.cds [Oikopleura dioica]|uniref:Oidioi.mRNA.OKI2018_I69.PAR.g9205.t1.cds n=1 Tax=Oikopleura dioica TaxID=34765 RepID=A0ABN7RS26_OIKDI|nr:Oidioi.mRNA.OKI2018_I69.PAR.g9205.t1.cds [Oikopleura dioica]
MIRYRRENEQSFHDGTYLFGEDGAGEKPKSLFDKTGVMIVLGMIVALVIYLMVRQVCFTKKFKYESFSRDTVSSAENAQSGSEKSGLLSGK